MKAFLLLLCCLFTGCVTQPLSVDVIYRKDLLMKIDGNNFYGVSSQDKKPVYNFKIYFYKKPTKFVMTTCHRYLVWSDPGNGVNYDYKPDPDLEQNENVLCPVEFGAFDDKGQSSWGYVDFRSTETLAAKLSCNGDIAVPVVGSSVCQTKMKLMERITFDAPVLMVSEPSCPVPESTDSKTFLIEVGRGKCTYLFQAGSQSHRLTLLGFDDVILR